MSRVPHVTQPISDQSGIVSRPWYVYLSELASSASSTVTPPTPPVVTGKISGPSSVSVTGLLPNVVTLNLVGDQEIPLNTQYYGSDGSGIKGWFNISDTILTSTLAKSVSTDGKVTIELPVLADAGGGQILRFARDSYGRVSGTSSATTDNLSEGSSNLYFTNARVASSLASGPGINLSTDGSGITTISDASLTLADLTDQSSDNLTSQSLVQLTANSVVGSIQVLLNFTLSTLPSASSYKYGTIFVTDLTGGGAPCYSDGTHWRRFSDNTIAS